jgi:CRP/FNR family cyclic AMP-dependent transcriptional regulator
MPITTVEAIGYLAAVLGIAMLAMKTMIPLRITGIAHNVCQIAFGLLSGVYPTVFQHIVLLPVNVYRLLEMVRLIKQVKAASLGDHSIDWLKPFMTKRSVRAGETLFRKGDEARQMYFILDGRFHVEEIGIDMAPGSLVGELGMLAPARKRTQTLVCREDGSILEMAYDQIKEIYYQNPTFGFYFLSLSTSRLFDDIERLQSMLAARNDEIKQLRAIQASPPSIS